METYTMQWLATLAFISLPLAALVLVWFASRGRLVRCPETGGLGLVDVGPAPGRGAEARTHCVRRCDLWLGRQGCAQGCLARHAQSAVRYGVDLKALRPLQRS
jgi:hypothetical protein